VLGEGLPQDLQRLSTAPLRADVGLR
jgi:hypothetical protein